MDAPKKHPFKFEDPEGLVLPLEDSITIPDSEYALLTAEELFAIQQDRFDRYKDLVLHPPQNELPAPPIDEEGG